MLTLSGCGKVAGNACRKGKTCSKWRPAAANYSAEQQTAWVYTVADCTVALQFRNGDTSWLALNQNREILSNTHPHACHDQYDCYDHNVAGHSSFASLNTPAAWAMTSHSNTDVTMPVAWPAAGLYQPLMATAHLFTSPPPCTSWQEAKAGKPRPRQREEYRKRLCAQGARRRQENGGKLETGF